MALCRGIAAQPLSPLIDCELGAVCLLHGGAFIKRIALLFGAAIAIPSIASENCESRLETKINSSFTETTDDVILAE